MLKREIYIKLRYEKFQRNGNITGRKDAPGGYIGSVLIFSCIGVHT